MVVPGTPLRSHELPFVPLQHATQVHVSSTHRYTCLHTCITTKLKPQDRSVPDLKACVHDSSDAAGAILPGHQNSPYLCVSNSPYLCRQRIF